MFIIFVGAIIAVVGTLLAAYGTLKQNISSSAKTAIQIEKLQELTIKNEQLAKQLAETSEDIKNNIVGGDNHLSMVLHYRNDTSSVLILANMSPTPIYDVSYRILDLDGIMSVDRQQGITDANPEHRPNGNLYAPFDYYGELGTLSGKTSKEEGIIPFGLTGEVRRFRIYSYARNGIIVTEVIYAKVDNRWVYASRSFRQMHRDNIIDNYTDPVFPLTHLHWY